MKRTSPTIVFIIAALLWFCGETAGYGEGDYTRYVSMVQDDNHPTVHRMALMRYPLGQIGLWSIDHGEFADCVSRGLRLYPCVDTVVYKDNTNDWRETITGDPSVMKIKYRDDVPAQGSSAELTVTPHVTADGGVLMKLKLTRDEPDFAQTRTVPGAVVASGISWMVFVMLSPDMR